METIYVHLNARKIRTGTYGSRPAFLIPSQYAVEVDGGLDQYTTCLLYTSVYTER